MLDTVTETSFAELAADRARYSNAGQYSTWESRGRALNAIEYNGPTCVEREDTGMDRLAGAPEALTFVRKLAEVIPPHQLFLAAFSSNR